MMIAWLVAYWPAALFVAICGFFIGVPLGALFGRDLLVQRESVDCHGTDVARSGVVASSGKETYVSGSGDV